MAARKKGLTPSIIKETTSLKKIELDQEVLEEFQAYIQWVGIQSVDEGIEKAIAYVLGDDAEWQKYKKSLAKSKTAKPSDTAQGQADKTAQ